MLQGVLILTSALAAVGFSRKADLEGDEFSHVLGLASVLGTFAPGQLPADPVALHPVAIDPATSSACSSWIQVIFFAARGDPKPLEWRLLGCNIGGAQPAGAPSLLVASPKRLAFY